MIERRRAHAAVTAFLALFSIVGIALYGLPFFYDFFVRDLGWTRAQVTSGNALSKVVVGPLFGFAAGWIVDRFGPRRLMLAGIVMAGAALVGLGSVTTLGFFYACYMLNALGNVCGGPLPNQVLLARWFDRNRGAEWSQSGYHLRQAVQRRVLDVLGRQLGAPDALRIQQL